MNTREKIEEWLSNAPKEITLCRDINVDSLTESVIVQGKRTPMIISKGYEGSIGFTCNKWDE